MCGRFTLKSRIGQIAQQLQLLTPTSFEPRYNIAPSQGVLAVRRAGTVNAELVTLQWGLVPRWADDPSIGHRLINARSETVAEKRAFRGAFAERRCLVIADGFYEWQRDGRHKQPYYLTLDSGQFAFAALWEVWQQATAPPLETCTLITTTANDVLKPFHDRMPVILQPADYERWLDPQQTPPAAAQELLRPYPAAAMHAQPVGNWVNSPAREGPRCVEPAMPSGQLRLFPEE
jgi:putative SOS response-associated peptidase YedK